MSDLAAATSTAQSRLSRIVTRLEAQNLVERSGHGGDKRVVVAMLTKDGVERVQAAAPRHVQHVRQMIFDKLSADQVRQLATICRLLAEEPSGSVQGTESSDNAGTEDQGEPSSVV